jgi:predicted CXXCH cytochrome family protein
MKLRLSYVLFLLALGLTTACSPDGSYKTLSFFFDGVPKPGSKIAVEPVRLIDNGGIQTIISPLTKKPEIQYVIHAPFGKQECTSCHDKDAKSTLIMPQPALCFKCHTGFKEKYAYMHGPVASGYCTACHFPHRSELPKLLKRKGQDLCLKCHQKTQVMSNQVHSVINDKNCTECHDPHGGKDRFLLK